MRPARPSSHALAATRSRQAGSRPPARRRDDGPVEVVRLLAADPALAGGLEGSRLAAAEQVAVRVVHARRGPLAVRRDPAALADRVGLLLLDGVLARRVTIGQASGSELMGPGDLVRPWEDRCAPHVPAGVAWRVIEPARLAVLDTRFARRTSDCPEILATLLDRALERSRALALQLAAAAVPGLDARIPMLLAMLARRWGRTIPEGLHLPVALTHSTIAEIAGARRPSVSVSIGRLCRAGRLARLDDGTWVIPQAPPAG